MKYKFDPERLAYWYLRLNGFLTIENFILHDERRPNPRTDIDLIAVRFPARQEALRSDCNREVSMTDDDCFREQRSLLAAFVEVTIGTCKINGPWTDPIKANLPRALRALGAVPRHQVETVAKNLYETGGHSLGGPAIRLISIGQRENNELKRKMPNAMQICFPQMLAFIFKRFAQYRVIKREHPQWDLDGHLIWNIFDQSRSEDDFVSSFVLIPDRPGPEAFAAFGASKIYNVPGNPDVL